MHPLLSRLLLGSHRAKKGSLKSECAGEGAQAAKLRQNSTLAQELKCRRKPPEKERREEEKSELPPLGQRT